MNNEWEVKFDRNGEPGREIALKKWIRWGEKRIYAPSVYACDEGFVLELCTQIDRESLGSFFAKWDPRVEKGLNRQEQRQIRRENPLNPDLRCHILVNGVLVQNWHTNGSSWIPEDIRPKMEVYHDRTEARLAHYGLDRKAAWSFQRFFYSWPQGKQEIESLSAKLYMDPQEFGGEPFSMPGVGKSLELRNPITGLFHTLTVVNVQSESITIPERFAEYEMPAEAAIMVYRLDPDLTHEQFQLKDTQEADQALKKDGMPYNAGCVGMMLRLPKDGTHAAASSMRFKAPETVLWEPIFREKKLEDITVELL